VGIHGSIISLVGEEAGVIVGQQTKLDDEGPRDGQQVRQRSLTPTGVWLSLVLASHAASAQGAMRDTEVATMMKFYVGVNAQATAVVLSRVEGNILGINDEKEPIAASRKST
jgi:hypothetical protein